MGMGRPSMSGWSSVELMMVVPNTIADEVLDRARRAVERALAPLRVASTSVITSIDTWVDDDVKDLPDATEDAIPVVLGRSETPSCAIGSRGGEDR